jgi:hypothetical protein
MSVWDIPELQSTSAYVKFENPGDTVTGTVINISAHKWDDGSVSPQILLQTADGQQTVTAGQVRLKAMLAERRPEVGDTLTITHTEVEKRAGGKTLKLWDVDIVRGGGATIIAGEAPNAEQLAAMKLLGMAAPF